MTLTTTEELKHLASSDNANELTRRLARECLANREAQPVGFRYRHKDTVSWLYNDWRWPDSVEADQCQIEWFYTAPPAPTPASEPIFFIEVEGDDWINAGRILGSTFDFNNLPDGVNKLYAAPPTPAVPDVVDYSDLDATSEDREVIEAIAECKGWNACRAAMLAQPVSQRYTLPPHVFRELVNSLRDTAVKYSGTDQLRERLNTALHQFIEPDHPHTRTVAPEGGNG